MLINNKISNGMNNYINTSNHALLKPIEEQLHRNKIQQNKNKNIEGFF